MLERVGQRLGQHPAPGHVEQSRGHRAAAVVDAQVHARVPHPGDQGVRLLEDQRVLGRWPFAQPAEQDADVVHRRARGVPDDGERLLGAVGILADHVAGTVRLRRHHGPRVGDQVVHVGRDAAALLLLLVQVVQPPALDGLQGGVGACLHGLASLPPHVPGEPRADDHHGGRGRQGQRTEDVGPQGSLVGEPDPLPTCRDHDGDRRARETEPAYADVAVTAQGDEQRDVRQAGEPRDVPTDDLHDGGGDRQRHHDERSHAADRERGAEEHRSEPGPSPQLGLDEPDDHGEPGTRRHVDEQSAAARPVGLTPQIGRHRAHGASMAVRPKPVPPLPAPVSESRERLSVAGCRMVP